MIKTLIFALVTSATLQSFGTLYNLKNDWSDTANPNGAWSIRSGTVVLPSISNSTMDSFNPAQKVYAFNPSSTPWSLKVIDPMAGRDWQPGDILMHSTDESNGAGHGPANVLWTSPAATTISISGNVWAVRDIGDTGGGFRGNTWQLFLNGTLLSAGVVSGGDPYSRAVPFQLTNGSGGAAAVSNLQVASGDKVMLEFDKTGNEGDYVGVNFSVTAVPEPSVAGLALIAGVACIFVVRRGRLIANF